MKIDFRFSFFVFIECGRTFQDNSGSFTSPGYYVPLNEQERCEWRITATHGERIVLNITDLVSIVVSHSSYHSSQILKLYEFC
jgi:hypothetical protein